jgi:hypothetical protein
VSIEQAATSQTGRADQPDPNWSEDCNASRSFQLGGSSPTSNTASETFSPDTETSEATHRHAYMLPSTSFLEAALTLRKAKSAVFAGKRRNQWHFR